LVGERQTDKQRKIDRDRARDECFGERQRNTHRNIDRDMDRGRTWKNGSGETNRQT